MIREYWDFAKTPIAASIVMMVCGAALFSPIYWMTEYYKVVSVVINFGAVIGCLGAAIFVAVLMTGIGTFLTAIVKAQLDRLS